MGHQGSISHARWYYSPKSFWNGTWTFHEPSVLCRISQDGFFDQISSELLIEKYCSLTWTFSIIIIALYLRIKYTLNTLSCAMTKPVYCWGLHRYHKNESGFVCGVLGGAAILKPSEIGTFGENQLQNGTFWNGRRCLRNLLHHLQKSTKAKRFWPKGGNRKANSVNERFEGRFRYHGDLHSPKYRR